MDCDQHRGPKLLMLAAATSRQSGGVVTKIIPGVDASLGLTRWRLLGGYSDPVLPICRHLSRGSSVCNSHHDLCLSDVFGPLVISYTRATNSISLAASVPLSDTCPHCAFLHVPAHYCCRPLLRVAEPCSSSSSSCIRGSPSGLAQQ